MIVIQYVFNDFDIGEKIEKLWILRKKLNNSNFYQCKNPYLKDIDFIIIININILLILIIILNKK